MINSMLMVGELGQTNVNVGIVPVTIVNWIFIESREIEALVSIFLK